MNAEIVSRRESRISYRNGVHAESAATPSRGRALSLPLAWPGLRSGLLFLLAYFVAYSFCFGLTSIMPSPLWFPDSVLLCALLLSPRDTWWFYLVSALPLRLFISVPAGLPVWYLTASFVNDSAKALLSAVLVQRFCGKTPHFDRLRQFLDYSLIAVVSVPLLSSIAGGAARHMQGQDFFTTTRAWFLGDALAGLVLTPVILCFNDVGRHILGASPKRYLEAALLMAGVSWSGYLAFMEYHSNAPFLLYLPVPFLLWAAVRFGPFGAACSLSGISALSIFAISHGQGPFGSLPASSAVLSLQLFLIVISFSLLALATVVRQQQASEAALRASEERLHQLSARLIYAQETECKRIGQELHEDVAQRVAALSIDLSALAQNCDNPEKLNTESFRLRRHAAAIVQDIARISHQLRPPGLETMGLPVALRSLCQRSSDPAATEVLFTQFGDVPALPWDVAVSLYRVAQESVTNALRHSGATRICVCLFSDNGTSELRISDNGKGFALDSSADRGMGLAGMAERMRSVGGRLGIHTMPGNGTEVVAFAPVLARAFHA